MLDARLAMGRTRAFVVAGSHHEWPEALAEKLAYTLHGDSFPPPQSLRLNLGMRSPIEHAPKILLRGLAKHYP